MRQQILLMTQQHRLMHSRVSNSLCILAEPTPHKNLERLIDAFAIMQETMPNLHLVLAGKKMLCMKPMSKTPLKGH